MNNIELIFGDTIEEMQKLIDEGIKVDMIFADLPYGTTDCKWDTIIPYDALWDKYNKLIRENGAIVLTASQPFTSALVMSNPKMFKYEWIWEKSKASNFLQTKHMPLKAHENILVFGKGKVNYYPQKTQGKPFNKGKDKRKGKATEVYAKIPNINGFEIKNEKGLRNPRTVQYFKTAESEGKHHPTQKPTWMIEYFIKTYTEKSDTILDNTMGSGSTAIACLNTNRLFIGIDNNKKYVQVAKKRVEEKIKEKD